MIKFTDILAAPAIDLRDGRVMVGRLGDTHPDLMDRASRLPSNVGHGFITHDGRYLSREQARYAMEDAGRPMPLYSPHSTDLIEEAMASRRFDAPDQPDPFPPTFYDPSAAGIYWPFAPYTPDPAKQEQDDPGNIFKMLLQYPRFFMQFLR